MSSEDGQWRLIAGVIVIAFGLFIVFLVSVWVPGTIDEQADRDDALDIAGGRLVHGLDPWDATTQLGSSQHISPLLGGVLIALPFVLVFGSSAIQSVFWSIIGGFGSLRALGLMRTSLIVLALITSPIFLNEILFQSDLWVNVVLISIASLWGFQVVTGSSKRLGWAFPASALLLGLALADRYIFVPVLIPIAVLMLREKFSRRSGIWLLLASAVTGILILIPWLIYPASLESTLWNFKKAASDAVPHSGLVLLVLMLVVAVLGTFLVHSPASAFGVMAATMFCVPLWQSIATSLGSHSLSFNGYTSVAYSVAFVIFGLLSLVLPKRELKARIGATSSFSTA